MFLFLCSDALESGLCECVHAVEVYWSKQFSNILLLKSSTHAVCMNIKERASILFYISAT